MQWSQINCKFYKKCGARALDVYIMGHRNEKHLASEQMNVQENINALQDTYDQVKAHCMCRAIHDDGAYYRVLYPAGMILDGVQAGYLITGKKAALDKILVAMEQHWKASGIN